MEAKTECSGNITQENIERVIETGVDYISSGALTHSLDLDHISLKIFVFYRQKEIKMSGKEKRMKRYPICRGAKEPISGTELVKIYNVSRQVYFRI